MTPKSLPRAIHERCGSGQVYSALLINLLAHFVVNVLPIGGLRPFAMRLYKRSGVVRICELSRSRAHAHAVPSVCDRVQAVDGLDGLHEHLQASGRRRHRSYGAARCSGPGGPADSVIEHSPAQFRILAPFHLPLELTQGFAECRN